MEKLEKVKRRYFTREQKAEIVRAFCSGDISCSQFAVKYRLHPALIYKWRKEMKRQEINSQSNEYRELLSELEEKRQKIEHLQKALSDSVIKVQILQKANEILKKSIRLKRYGLRKKS